jgi:cell division protein FtsI/penicillin-binding protein 2
VTGPDPAETAGALAAALESGDFGDVAFRGLTPQAVGRDYAAVVDGLGDLTPSVHAGDVREGSGSGDTATARLAWTWSISGEDWTYTTTADLTRAGDAWDVTWKRALVEPDLAPDDVLSLSSVAPQRGAILGAHGRPIVVDRPVVRFGIDREQVPATQAAESARRLAALLDVDPASYARQVRAAGPRAFVEAIVLRKDDVPVAVARGYRSIRGARAIPGTMPLAPTREFAAALLGRVGPVTADMVKEHPDTYRPGDEAGVSGLQARYDDRLRGTPGAVVSVVAPDGSADEVHRVKPVAGRPLRITLDERLQQVAERQLASVGPASALVALRPSTGQVLAAANGPGTDGYDLATYGQAAPGSTFKMVSSLALLRSGLTPDSVVPCTPSVTVDGKRFENYSDYPASAVGRVTLRTAIANSCNTAVISQRHRLQPGDLAAAAATLGFGVDHDAGFPAYFGAVPMPGSSTEAAADLIGQGGVLASPMAMATVIGSVQAGRTVVPRLVEGVDGLDLAVPDQAAPLTAGEDAQLRSLLRAVVTSGSGRGLLDLPGPPAIAKTGTAEFERHGRTLTHAWMVGAQGDLAVAVFVDVGSSGSGTAGPILEAFLRAARS